MFLTTSIKIKLSTIFFTQTNFTNSSIALLMETDHISNEQIPNDEKYSLPSTPVPKVEILSIKGLFRRKQSQPSPQKAVQLATPPPEYISPRQRENQSGLMDTAQDQQLKKDGDSLSIDMTKLQPEFPSITPDRIYTPAPPIQSIVSRLRNNQAWFVEMRGQLIVVAVLAASVTYASGLSPPGGFWQDDYNNHIASNNHTAGTSIMHDKNPKLYKTFNYANAMAFITSLTIIVLLIDDSFSPCKMYALRISTIADLLFMIVAFLTGITRNYESFIFMSVFIVFAFVLISCAAPLIYERVKRRADIYDPKKP